MVTRQITQPQPGPPDSFINEGGEMRKSAKVIIESAPGSAVGRLSIPQPWPRSTPRVPPRMPRSAKTRPTHRSDAVTQGACVILERTKGNCMACRRDRHRRYRGNIAPPLVATVKQRFPTAPSCAPRLTMRTASTPKERHAAFRTA